MRAETRRGEGHWGRERERDGLTRGGGEGAREGGGTEKRERRPGRDVCTVRAVCEIRLLAPAACEAASVSGCSLVSWMGVSRENGAWRRWQYTHIHTQYLISSTYNIHIYYTYIYISFNIP
jgi:hypothetical protein